MWPTTIIYPEKLRLTINKRGAMKNNEHLRRKGSGNLPASWLGLVL